MPTSTNPANSSSGNSETDWISALTSLVAAIVSLITLLTVYLAALQILSRRQLYRLGLSKKYLGQWKEKVSSSSSFKMQTQISTPTVNLPKLITGGVWKPNFALPTGFIDDKQKNATPDLEHGKVLADASWVNFLQALDFSPEKDKLYEMQSEPELVNGIVPMRWKGRDLVAICSMLGFQSSEKDTNFKTSMVLPTQWSGPLGWLQFRASFDGCIVEYRRMSEFKNQLPVHIHEFYGEPSNEPYEINIKSRAWHSISGLCLPGDKALYLGGQGTTFKSRNNNTKRSTHDICNDILDAEDEPSEEDIKRMLWPNKEDRPNAVTGLSRSEPETMSRIPDLFRGIFGKDGLGDEKIANKVGDKTVIVLSPCPGLFSMIIEKELAVTRGLDPKTCEEFDRRIIDLEEFDNTYGDTHPYSLGHLRMGEQLMKHIKNALLLLKPDGYYFTPTNTLCVDIYQIFKTIDEQSDDGEYKHIFSEPILKAWKTAVESTEHEGEKATIERLYHAMDLCDRFQSIKMSTRLQFSIEDIKIISRASISLDEIIQPIQKNQNKPESSAQVIEPTGTDLTWAIIASPGLFQALVQRFKEVTVQDVVDKKVEFKDGYLDCASLFPEKVVNTYKVPLMDTDASQEFTVGQLLAAFLDAFLTYFWIENKWSSNVAFYDVMVPQSVIMC